MRALIGTVFVLFISSLNFVQAQNQSVSLCPLILAIQNRCPTPSTTRGTTTMRPTTNSNSNGTASDETDVVDSCGAPVITFCPAMQAFLSGARNCTNGQTIQISLTTLGQLLINPSTNRAAEIVGSSNVDDLGDALTSVSKTIQATPTQATVGITFIPVGQIIG